LPDFIDSIKEELFAMPILSRRDFLRYSAVGALSSLAAPLLLNNSAQASPALTATPSITPLPPAKKSMRGLYALMARNNDAIPPDLFASPTLTGFTLQIDWSILQPEPNVVAWDIVDAAISRAKDAKKKIALRPLAGTGAPAWLYKAGVKKFTFTPDSDRYHPLAFGNPLSMPYPWDKTLLEAWGVFIQALGDHFDKEPGLARIAVSGPVYQQAEMYLPHADTVMADWTKAGYSLTNMQAAWQKIIDGYAQVFKETPFTLDMNPLADPMDKSGATLNGLVPVSIAQYGLLHYPGRFFPAQSDLSDVYPWLPSPLPGPTKQPALYQSYERQTVPIYHFLANAAKTSQIGILVSEGRMSRTDTRIKDVLERALLLKASYVEIPVAWASDPTNDEALKSLFSTNVG
jgi:hypothetical protein